MRAAGGAGGTALTLGSSVSTANYGAITGGSAGAGDTDVSGHQGYAGGVGGTGVSMSGGAFDNGSTIAGGGGDRARARQRRAAFGFDSGPRRISGGEGGVGIDASAGNDHQHYGRPDHRAPVAGWRRGRFRLCPVPHGVRALPEPPAAKKGIRHRGRGRALQLRRAPSTRRGAGRGRRLVHLWGGSGSVGAARGCARGVRLRAQFRESIAGAAGAPGALLQFFRRPGR